MDYIVTIPFFLFTIILDIDFSGIQNWEVVRCTLGSTHFVLSLFCPISIFLFITFSSMFLLISVLLPSVVLFNSLFRNKITLAEFGRSWLQLFLPAKHSESYHCLQKLLYIHKTVCLPLVIWFLFSFSGHVFKHPDPVVKNRRQQLPVTGMIKNVSFLTRKHI